MATVNKIYCISTLLHAYGSFGLEYYFFYLHEEQWKLV